MAKPYNYTIEDELKSLEEYKHKIHYSTFNNFFIHYDQSLGAIAFALFLTVLIIRFIIH